ncbi:MAG: hypothetical protein U0Q11_24040 [Vicinamibacterales bacterium]
MATLETPHRTPFDYHLHVTTTSSTPSSSAPLVAARLPSELPHHERQRFDLVWASSTSATATGN